MYCADAVMLMMPVVACNLVVLDWQRKAVNDLFLGLGWWDISDNLTWSCETETSSIDGHDGGG